MRQDGRWVRARGGEEGERRGLESGSLPCLLKPDVSFLPILLFYYPIFLVLVLLFLAGLPFPVSFKAF